MVAYQPADKPVPQIVIACVEFIESEGITCEFLEHLGQKFMTSKFLVLFRGPFC